MKSTTTMFSVCSMVNLCLVYSGGSLATTMDVLAQSTNVFINKIPPAAPASTTIPPSTTIATSSLPPPNNRIRIRKISTMINQQLNDNLIPGASDYVPVKQSLPNIENATVVSVIPVPKPHSTTNLTTNSNANVFEAIPSAKHGAKDPFQVNAQQQNPFMSGVGGMGGINPQIAMLLRNNPRLQMLARQNPVIAQQIMRNPQLLRNPMIQRAIQSQLSDGQGGQNLLGQIGQLGLTGLNGLGRALNPLGLPIGNPLMRGNNNNNNNHNNAANGRNRLNQMNLNNNEGNLQNFGLPNNNHQQQNLGRRTNPHQDTLNGGYYGDNQNYNPPPSPLAENNEVDDDGQNDEENAIDPGQQDYGGGGGDNTGEENGEGGGGVGGDGDGSGGGGGGDDSQQNPADDPDIQQLQNFGGPMNDNFPEGLFPPGLLSKEDIQEIRRQQEKQQREDEERERQQQLQQQQYNNNNQPETSSPDYEDVNGGGENAEENAGTEQPEEGAGGEGGDEEVGHDQQVDNGNVEPGGGMVMDHNPNHHNHNHNHNHNDNGQNVNVYTTPMPPAYRNAYQPIQPGHQGNVPSSLMNQNGGHGANEYQQVPQHQGPMAKNQFNLGGSNVEYEPPTHHDHTNDGGLNHQNGYTSTFAPPNRGHYESPLRPHSHHRGHYSPNMLRHNGDDRQSIHHPYPRPKLSQYSMGHHQISNIDGHKDRDDFPRSALYQDNDIDDGHHHRPPKTTFSSILNHQQQRQQRHPDLDRTTSKYPRPRMRLF